MNWTENRSQHFRDKDPLISKKLFSEYISPNFPSFLVSKLDFVISVAISNENKTLPSSWDKNLFLCWWCLRSLIYSLCPHSLCILGKLASRIWFCEDIDHLLYFTWKMFGQNFIRKIEFQKIHQNTRETQKLLPLILASQAQFSNYTIK